jgi:hypothetical protein
MFPGLFKIISNSVLSFFHVQNIKELLHNMQLHCLGALMVPRPFATAAHKEALGTPGRADGRPALFYGWARSASGTALASGPGNANRGGGAGNDCPTLKLDLNPLVAS